MGTHVYLALHHVHPNMSRNKNRWKPSVYTVDVIVAKGISGRADSTRTQPRFPNQATQALEAESINATFTKEWC